jgi:hypothetical protein
MDKLQFRDWEGKMVDAPPDLEVIVASLDDR